MNGTPAQRAGITLLAIILLGVGVYDLIAALFMPPGSTISAILLDLARKHPILPLLTGIVLGHLFWPQ
ncbi:hypothetical protein AYO40_00580 [Planctomycetaceae bacterium SCGC AG-212-D15]|nr:hypothetical protein AYO40_00580 [Planctomycetaceae bacterium SCGC AG-212-D15]